MPDELSIELLARYRQGDNAAADALFERFASRLIALARTRISPKLGRRIDAEDVAQSAFRSFFGAVDEGKFDISQSGDLWRLLTAITLNKLRMQARYHLADKRGLAREESTASGENCSGYAPEQLAQDPSPQEAAALEEIVQNVMLTLEPLQQRMLELRLQGYQIEEISQQVERSERTVRRLLDRIKSELQTQLNDG
ncbi:MAG: sigma-70 family RNA polymerase sigma factor [Pirellulaceae bacterium]|nr:sigma-70 family RNA polymerase sigma factor [Planctomycetales bacterium]